jgi:hypothetical protein
VNILVSAIEVGSVRSVIPVCVEIINNGDNLLIDNRGHFKVEPIESLSSSLVRFPEDSDILKKFILQKSIDVVLFSVNIHDTRPLEVARIAQSLKIKTIHLLDYWNGYRSRMELDGQEMFIPSKYLVPDEYAKRQAIEEGISDNIVTVVGQPAFTDAESNFQKSRENNLFNVQIQDIQKKNKKVILFASEPVANDQGKSIEENSNYRGYTEIDALTVLVQALKNSSNDFFVIVLPHPRQNIKELELIWQSLGGDSYGSIMSDIRGRELLPFVVGASGMASTLLYEAWLVGLPVLSIQPGLLHKSLRMLQEKSNTTFIDNYDVSVKITEEWLELLQLEVDHVFQPDLYMHVDAAKMTLKELKS